MRARHRPPNTRSGLRSAPLLFAAAALLAFADRAVAQPTDRPEPPQAEGAAVATSFVTLQSILRTGDPLIVTTARGTRVRGTLLSLSDSSLELLEDGSPARVTRFTEAGARIVGVLRRDSPLDGTLYGLSAGLPPLAGWMASGSGTKTSTAVAVIGGSAAAGAAIGYVVDRTVTDAMTVYEAAPATTIEDLRPLAAPGDRLTVSTRDGRRVRGRLAHISDTSLQLAGTAGALDMHNVLEVQVERRDRWWPSAAAGAATGLALTEGLSYAIRCSNQGITGFRVVDGVTVLESPCLGFDPPAGDYVLFGLAGAAAGGLIDWLWRERTTVFRAQTRTDAHRRIVLTASRAGRGVRVSVSF